MEGGVFCGIYFLMKSVVESAVASGVSIVVAGGKSNSDACGFMPAFVPAAITVGSTDSEDARSYFSNYGRCTDIWAPDVTRGLYRCQNLQWNIHGLPSRCGWCSLGDRTESRVLGRATTLVQHPSVKSSPPIRTRPRSTSALMGVGMPVFVLSARGHKTTKICT